VDAGAPDAGPPDAGGPASGYTAARLGAPPVIDGQLSEYELLPHLDLASGGSSADVRLAWDDQALYVAYQVRDSNLDPSPGTPQTLYQGDSVELMVDPFRHRGSSADATDVHMVVDVAGQLAATQGWTNYSFTSGARVAVNLEGASLGGPSTGYAVELALPWQSLGITPAAGLSIGCDVAVNDLAGTNLLSFDWQGLTSFNDPAGWGTISLGSPQGTTGSTGTSGISGSSGSAGSTGTAGSAGSTSGASSPGHVGAKGGCGCNTSPREAAWLWALLALGRPLRRRNT
jgi:MYXO-CTERM domain-containing protein